MWGPYPLSYLSETHGFIPHNDEIYFSFCYPSGSIVKSLPQGKLLKNNFLNREKGPSREKHSLGLQCSLELKNHFPIY